MKKGVSTSSSGKRKLFLRGHVSQFTTRPNPNHGIQVQGTPPGHVAPRARLNHAPGAQVPPLDEADAGARLLEAARAGAHKRNERDDEEHQQEREQEQRAEEAAVLVEPHGGHDVRRYAPLRAGCRGWRRRGRSRVARWRHGGGYQGEETGLWSWCRRSREMGSGCLESCHG